MTTEGDGMSQAFDGPDANRSALPADAATMRVIRIARERAAELGDGSDAGTLIVLARMLRVAASGIAAGYIRLEPEQPVDLKLDTDPPVA